MNWPVQKAQARFDELLEASVKGGPQIITMRGVETAVLVSIEEWRRLQQQVRPNLKDLLLAAEPRFEGGLPYPRRGRWRMRPPPLLE